MPDVDREILKEEFEDLQLIEDNIICTVEDDQPRRLDSIWSDVMALKTVMGAVRFPCLTQVYVALLSLPHSNADCERAFSMVRKIHTDARKTLLPETLTSYLQCKLNFDSFCHDFEVTTEMRRLAKGAAYANKVEHLPDV